MIRASYNWNGYRRHSTFALVRHDDEWRILRETSHYSATRRHTLRQDPHGRSRSTLSFVIDPPKCDALRPSHLTLPRTRRERTALVMRTRECA